MIYYIYKIKNPNGKIYIGQTKTLMNDKIDIENYSAKHREEYTIL